MSASTTFVLNVANTNDVPTVATPVADLSVAENANLAFTLPAGTFRDVDAGDSLTLSAVLANGEPLPAWLVFDAARGSFSGTPGVGNLADHAIRVTARDPAGAEAAVNFKLSVVAAPPQALVGTEGVDALTGLSGNDTLAGDAGNDTLSGGLGNDSLDGGAGNDVYVYRLGDGVDHIRDGGGNDLLVLDGVTAQQVVLGVGSLKLTLPDGGEIHLDDFDPDRPFEGAIETFEFGDGALMSRQQLIETLGFRIEGTAGDDMLSGTALGEPLRGYAGNDVLTARAGDDVVEGGAGDDLLDGGAGDDTLIGGEGNDGYRFGAGDGSDTVTDTQGANVVRFKPGLSEADVELRQVGGDLVVTLDASGDKLTVNDWFEARDSDWALRFADGMVFDRAAVDVHLIRNEAPLAADDGAVLGEDGGAAWGNVLANDSDPEAGMLRVTNPGNYAGIYGSLSLAANGSYIYTLGSAVHGLAAGQTMTERFGYTITDDDPDGALTALAEIAVSIVGANDAPTLAVALSDREVVRDSDFSWQLPAGIFRDADAGGTLAYSAALVDGSALPSWLGFNAATRTFAGHAPKQLKDAVDVRVTATDGYGAAASDVFHVAIIKDEKDRTVHGNEGVGNGEDAPPPGHDGNFNDAFGTAPGYPGAAHVVTVVGVAPSAAAVGMSA